MVSAGRRALLLSSRTCCTCKGRASTGRLHTGTLLCLALDGCTVSLIRWSVWSDRFVCSVLGRNMVPLISRRGKPWGQELGSWLRGRHRGGLAFSRLGSTMLRRPPIASRSTSSAAMTSAETVCTVKPGKIRRSGTDARQAGSDTSRVFSA